MPVFYTNANMHICLFDIDGTLLLSGGAGKAAMEAALASAFGATTSSGNVPFSGRTDRAIGRDLFQRHGIEESPENWQRFLTAYLDHLPSCLASHQGRVLPGIAALLQQLHRQNDVLLGLLTGNVREGARLKLGHFGLFHYFAFGGFGDQHHHRDDVARDAWHTLQQRLNGQASPERVWVIGDTPLDVQCARAIGARAVAVATGWHSLEELAGSQPDLLVPDLSDPGPLLARLR
jgi:phosphoglycolate phosphatase-like HAD superfamily hydrolase